MWILPLVSSAETVNTVERGGLITFSQGGIVEHVVDEILHSAFERHDGLPDVDEFARTFPDNMNT